MAGVSVVLALFLAVLSAKEQDNRFCVACHLHEDKLTRFGASASKDLAGFHFQRDGRIGCIACHGGEGPARRLTVWSVAALDTARFLVGAYEEPTRMRLPIPDPECRRCHSPILKPAPGAAAGAGSSPVPAPGARPPAAVDPSDESTFAAAAPAAGRSGASYHILRDHDGVNVRCVRCHTTHTADSDSANQFISRAIVQPVCRECHKQM